MSNKRECLVNYPRITVVTPSFNQAKFLERTIQSVLNQGYPNLEYFIIDGGSTDGSIEIIRKYEKHLAWWVSETDNGQAEAINKGFRRSTGDWIAWQNSDDIYFSNTFFKLAEASQKFPDASLLIGNLALIDADDNHIRDLRYITPNYNALRAEGMLLANQAAFWKRELFDELGPLEDTLHYLFDYEWFLRVTSHVKGRHVSEPWGALRLHAETKTSKEGAKFKIEMDQVLTDRKMSYLLAMFYKLRRYSLLLLQGHIWYVVRGIFRRVDIKYKELHNE